MELSWWWLLVAGGFAGWTALVYRMGRIVGGDQPYRDGFLDGWAKGMRRGYQHCIDDMMVAPSQMRKRP